MDYDNSVEDEFEDSNISESFYYCFGCFAIAGIFDLFIPSIEETEHYVKDASGRVFSKVLCTSCQDTIKDGDMIYQVKQDNQMQNEEYIDIEISEPGKVKVDDYINSMVIISKLGNLKKKVANEVKKRKPK